MKLIATAVALFLGQTLVSAQDEPPPPRPVPHDKPHVVLGPPEHKPPMSKDPAETHKIALDQFFKFMDADGNGEIDISEFREWVWHFHMPPPEKRVDDRNWRIAERKGRPTLVGGQSTGKNCWTKCAACRAARSASRMPLGTAPRE